MYFVLNHALLKSTTETTPKDKWKDHVNAESQSVLTQHTVKNVSKTHLSRANLMASLHAKKLTKEIPECVPMLEKNI